MLLIIPLHVETSIGEADDVHALATSRTRWWLRWTSLAWAYIIKALARWVGAVRLFVQSPGDCHRHEEVLQDNGGCSERHHDVGEAILWSVGLHRQSLGPLPFTYRLLIGHNIAYTPLFLFCFNESLCGWLLYLLFPFQARETGIDLRLEQNIALPSSSAVRLHADLASDPQLVVKCSQVYARERGRVLVNVLM